MRRRRDRGGRTYRFLGRKKILKKVLYCANNYEKLLIIINNWQSLPT